MVLAAKFSERQGFCSGTIPHRLKAHLDEWGFVTDFQGLRKKLGARPERRRTDRLHGAGQEAEGRRDDPHPSYRDRRRVRFAERVESRPPRLSGSATLNRPPRGLRSFSLHAGLNMKFKSAARARRCGTQGRFLVTRSRKHAPGVHRSEFVHAEEFLVRGSSSPIG